MIHAHLLHLLLPFSLPAREVMRDLAAHRQWPAFSGFIQRAAQIEHTHEDAFARALPHQRWLARCFGAVQHTHGANDAPFAPYMQLADQVETGVQVSQAMKDLCEVSWACIEPVHVQIAHDHLVLMPPNQRVLSTDEATQLLNAARPIFTSLGYTLEAPTPLRWYVQDSALTTLNCAAPQAAVGRNIDLWLPKRPDTGARSMAWMKLQNEVQIAWFEHPVNRAREALGTPTVNSIWLHACGRLKPVECPFSQIYSDEVATRGLGLAAHAEVKPLPEIFRREPTRHACTLVELDRLNAPFIARDWSAWCAAMTELERTWFAPAYAALKSGVLRTLRLTLTGETSALTVTATRADLYKFWRRRCLVELLFE